MEIEAPSSRAAWSLAEISHRTGLSIGYLRNEQRAGRLPVKRFGRRILVLDGDLQKYLAQGSERARDLQNAA
jgi:hypothetical protein